MTEVPSPKLIVKKKQIPTLVEFCLDENIEFSVKQQTFPDIDWEFEMKIKDFRTAILLGMYLRENRIEMDGIDPQRYKRAVKKADDKAEPAPKEEKTKQEKTFPITPSDSSTLM